MPPVGRRTPVEKPNGGQRGLGALTEEWWWPGGQARASGYPAVAFRPAWFPRDCRPPETRELGCGVRGSWVQLGLTQRVTPAESLPLGRLPASVSSGRAGSWEQGLAGNKKLVLHLWTPKQASPICQMEVASCSPQPEMLNTQGVPWDHFPRKPSS